LHARKRAERPRIGPTIRRDAIDHSGEIVDQEWGRLLFVRAPDGAVLQIDEQDRELYT
jgi:hypothetical protein